MDAKPDLLNSLNTSLEVQSVYVRVWVEQVKSVSAQTPSDWVVANGN